MTFLFEMLFKAKTLILKLGILIGKKKNLQGGKIEEKIVVLYLWN